MTEIGKQPDAAGRAEAVRGRAEALVTQIRRVFFGQERVLEELLWALLAGGHCLLEGVPGLGKTVLVRALAQSLGLDFSRIQFTPDLMPADITGTTILEEASGAGRRFRFQEGPLFAHVVLADEINRATPRTQAALLEAMQEQQVTAGGKTRPLPDPFLVLATQNPIELEGTWPLPEAQLDRFLFKVVFTMPGQAELETILERTTGSPGQTPEPALGREDLLEMRRLTRLVVVPAHVLRAAAATILATHPGSPHATENTGRLVRYGASPRGGQAMLLAARARALLQGRLHVSEADLREVALPALRHRVILRFAAAAEGQGVESLVQEWLERGLAQAR